jgi:hypothetical protein
VAQEKELEKAKKEAAREIGNLNFNDAVLSFGYSFIKSER